MPETLMGRLRELASPSAEGLPDSVRLTEFILLAHEMDGRLIEPTTLTEAVAAARAEGVREGLEAAAQNCEMRASVWRHHNGKPSETPVDAQIAAVFDSAAQALRSLPAPPTTPGGRTEAVAALAERGGAE